MNEFRKQVEVIIDAEYSAEGWEYRDVNNIFFYSEYSEDSCPELFNAFVAANIKVEYADSYGGEGMGDRYWTVYKFSQGENVEYLKFDGWYQSYNGAEFSEYFWVKPKQVTVTKFVAD